MSMLFKRIKDWATSITAFRTGDVIPVDGPSGTAKMTKDNLLKETAQNALAGNVAPAFDPTRTSENPYKAGESVTYEGKTYTFKVDHYGVWNASHVYDYVVCEEVARNVSNLSKLNDSVQDLADCKSAVEVLALWDVGGIDDSGIDTDNDAYRRTSRLDFENGQTVTITAGEGLAVDVVVYRLDGTFSSKTQNITTLTANDQRYYRFMTRALSGYTIPNKIWDAVKITIVNRNYEKFDDVNAKITTECNGVKGTNSVLRSCIKSVKLYGFDNTKPVYFGLLRKNYNSSGKTVFNIYRDGVYELVTLNETTGTNKYLITNQTSGASGDLLNAGKAIEITIDMDAIPDPTDYSLNATTGLICADNVFGYEYPDVAAEHDFSKTIGNGIDGTNTALRSAVKSIDVYGVDNTKPVYFGLLRKNYNSSGKTVFNIYRDGVFSLVTLNETTGVHRYLLNKDTAGVQYDFIVGNVSVDITIDFDKLSDPTDYSLNATTGLIASSHIHEFIYPDVGADTAIETYPYLGLLDEEAIEDTTITDLESLTGKTCYLVGDSMVAAGSLETYLGTRLGLVCTNYGYGGSTIAVNNATLTGKSIVERVLGTATSDNIEGSGDIWVIWGGYNDASYRDTPLGDINSNDNSTLYGALKTICKTIQEKKNNPRILLVTMHQSSNRMITAPGHDGKGVFIRDMREAFYQVGELFGIPVCDLYKKGGISPVNNLQMTSDGVHLNSFGKQFIYPKIANAIKDMV